MVRDQTLNLCETITTLDNIILTKDKLVAKYKELNTKHKATLKEVADLKAQLGAQKGGQPAGASSATQKQLEQKEKELVRIQEQNKQLQN